MLRLYNTLSRRLEEFRSLDEEERGERRVRMYVCGPTVYDSAHLGHARPAVVFDVLRRYLESLGYEVTFVSNFTDVDDKIIARARREGSSEPEVAERYMNEYLEDMDALNVKRASRYPRCTEHIGEMIEIIGVLLEKGFAYEIGGDVFFRVRKFGGYGKLSGRSLDELKQARIEPDERKENPEDFALWKSAKEGEPSWDAPWGKGRPGWHIECSAMSWKYLGVPFDIHGGGADLVFPHHENEIAQTEAAFGRPMARFWIHNGFININKEKMSKSLGNVFNLRDAFRQYPPAALRLFLLGTHYRKDVNFTPERLAEATSQLEGILEAADKASETEPVPPDEAAMERFNAALDDDLNTARALAVVHETVSAVNSGAGGGKAAALRRMLSVLGLPEKREEALAEGGNGSERALLDLLAEVRNELRKQKRFDLADLIRDRLDGLGFELRDLPGGRWEVKRKL